MKPPYRSLIVLAALLSTQLLLTAHAYDHQVVGDSQEICVLGVHGSGVLNAPPATPLNFILPTATAVPAATLTATYRHTQPASYSIRAPPVLV